MSTDPETLRRHARALANVTDQVILGAGDDVVNAMLDERFAAMEAAGLSPREMARLVVGVGVGVADHRRSEAADIGVNLATFEAAPASAIEPAPEPVATPFGWAHETPEPFTPNEAAVVDLALEHQNLDVLETLAEERLRQAMVDPYAALGVERPGPDCPIDPRAHAVATRLMAQQEAVRDLPVSPSSRTSRSSAPAKTAAKTLRRR